MFLKLVYIYALSLFAILINRFNDLDKIELLTYAYLNFVNR